MKTNEFKAWIEGFRSIGKTPDIEQWTQICEMIEEIEEEVPIVIPQQTYPYPVWNPVLPHWNPYHQPYWPYHSYTTSNKVPFTTLSESSTDTITAIYNDGVEGAEGISCPGAVAVSYTDEEHNWSHT